LNVEADALAKATVATPHTRPAYYKLLGSTWACYAGKQRIVKQFDGMLWSFINRQEMQTYWEKGKDYQPILCGKWIGILSVERCANL